MDTDTHKKLLQTESIYNAVTRRIIEKMEQGVKAWRGWQHQFQGAYPINYVTKRPYRGINALRLMVEGRSPWWLSEAQVEKLHGTLCEDARGVTVIGIFAFEHTTRNNHLLYRAVQSTVYNLDDVKGVRQPRHPSITSVACLTPVDACEQFIKNMPPRMPKVTHGGDVACYNWKKDTISMPHVRSFETMEDYYAVLFHEYAHSTGHSSRLDRNQPAGEYEYAFEELIAELASGFVCTICGIHQHTEDATATYLERWIKILKQNPRQLVVAASYAQNVSDYLQRKRKKKVDKDRQAADAEPRKLITLSGNVKLSA